jgi:hypothetical protein
MSVWNQERRVLLGEVRDALPGYHEQRGRYGWRKSKAPGAKFKQVLSVQSLESA